MKFLTLFSVIIGCCCLVSHGVNAAERAWSSQAKGLEVNSSGGYSPVISPDGRTSFSFDGSKFGFRNIRGGVLVDLPDYISTPDLVEVSWSADAEGVFINASDGGATGKWKTQVFLRTEAGLRELPIEEMVEKRSTLKTDCVSKNVGSVAWLKGAHKLLVLEQVPDSSACSNMGKAVGYVVDVDAMRVTEVLTDRTVKARFHALLGPQGLAAVD